MNGPYFYNLLPVYKYSRYIYQSSILIDVEYIESEL